MDEESVIEISKWFGLRNVVAPERLKPGDLAVALDVDVDDDGALRTRAGQTSISATASHSMFSAGDLCLVMQGSDMKRMAADGSLTQLKRLTYGGPVSYAELNGVVYFSNGVDTGRVVNESVREWGIRAPVGQPVATMGGGSLPPGRYLYALTFVRDDGIESGTEVPALVTLTDRGGIDFSQLEVSSDPDVVAKALYVSGTDGTELYRVAMVTAATSTYTFREALALGAGVPLDPDPVEPAPPGTIVEIYNGVAYVVDGSTVWMSDQYNLERFRRRSRFLQLPGPISLFAAVGDGVFAATDKATWFLTGADLAEARDALGYGAVPGTATKFDGEELLSEADRTGASQPAALWATPQGIVVGTTGGAVKNLTSGRHSIPAATRGAGLFRASRGYASFVVSLQGNGSAPSAY